MGVAFGFPDPGRLPASDLGAFPPGPVFQTLVALEIRASNLRKPL
jgi:hypothetical protein